MQDKKTNKMTGLRLKSVFLSFALLLAGCGGANGASALSQAADSNASGDSGSNQASALAYAGEIDQNSIMSFEISVDPASWQTMLDNAQKEEYIPADVTINGFEVKNVGIRPKGNSSLSSIARNENSDRYSFKLKFDEYVDGQTWLGLDKIVINSHFSDPTYMKEYLSYDIMNTAGVKAPLFAYADIFVNGESWGFYLAIEEMDSGYRERNGLKGEMYKPEGGMGGGQPGGMPDRLGGARAEAGSFPAAPGNAGAPVAEGAASPEDMRQSGGQTRPAGVPGENMRGMSGNGAALQYIDDEITSYSAIFDNAETKSKEADHRRVITALKKLSEGTELETYVDVEATLRYFAAHTAVVNLDSYISNMAHNYYLYENNGQISILPWDYNLAFGGFQSGSASEVVNFPIDTPVSGVSMEDRPLLGKLLAVPEYQEKYHEYLQNILDSYFNHGKFEQKVDELNKLIAVHVQNDPSAFYTYDKYQTALAALKKLGTLRAESIQAQLDGTVPSTAEGQRNNPSALIDASGVNLSELGSQGRGGQDRQQPGGDMGGWQRLNDGMTGGQAPNLSGMGMPEGLDQAKMQAVMEILRSVQNGEFTEEQKSKLRELGLSEEQITQMLNMPQRGGIPDGERNLQPGGGR